VNITKIQATIYAELGNQHDPNRTQTSTCSFD